MQCVPRSLIGCPKIDGCSLSWRNIHQDPFIILLGDECSLFLLLPKSFREYNSYSSNWSWGTKTGKNFHCVFQGPLLSFFYSVRHTCRLLKPSETNGCVCLTQEGLVWISVLVLYSSVNWEILFKWPTFVRHCCYDNKVSGVKLIKHLYSNRKAMLIFRKLCKLYLHVCIMQWLFLWAIYSDIHFICIKGPWRITE